MGEKEAPVEIMMRKDKDGSEGRRWSCAGMERFLLWQIGRYRQAVSEDRCYMSQNQHRFVAWAVAESDFIGHGTYGCAEEWRREYCSGLCPHSADCELGRYFCRELDDVAG